MPLYEYVCDNCGYQFEIVHSIHEDALLRCEKCDTHSLRRIITGGIYASVKKSDDEIKLGHLADRNRSRLSEDHKEHIKIKNAPKGARSTDPKEPVPVFDDKVASDYKLASLSPQQKKKYIEKGIIE